MFLHGFSPWPHVQFPALLLTCACMSNCHGQGWLFCTLGLIGDRDCVTVGAEARGDNLQGA